VEAANRSRRQHLCARHRSPSGLGDRRQYTAAGARALQAGGRPFVPRTAHFRGQLPEETKRLTTAASRAKEQRRRLRRHSLVVHSGRLALGSRDARNQTRAEACGLSPRPPHRARGVDAEPAADSRCIRVRRGPPRRDLAADYALRPVQRLPRTPRPSGTGRPVGKDRHAISPSCWAQIEADSGRLYAQALAPAPVDEAPSRRAGSTRRSVATGREVAFCESGVY
jgi:hypothetical protein